MIRSLQVVVVFSGALILGVFLGAIAKVPRAYADVAGFSARSEAYIPNDPKKKMPGDACKSSDECQKHHTCAKVGDKSVCQASLRPRLPSGAVI